MGAWTLVHYGTRGVERMLPVLLAMLFVGLTSVEALAASVRISEKEYGSKWPFTVLEGVLSCEVLHLPGGFTTGAITFTAGENVYAINGIARGLAKERGWKDIVDDRAFYKIGFSLQPVIDRGVKLCGLAQRP